MSWALSAITGNPAVNFLRMSGVWNAFKPAGGGTLSQEGEFSDDEFFKFLHRIKRNGAFVCCSTIVPPDRKGLINGHAQLGSSCILWYSVLDLQTVAPDVTSGEYFRLVQIRNPHGQGEWQGAPGTWCGPVISSLWGCFEYWCCCVGCKRLYLGRAGGKNLDEMKKDMNNRCGYDQRGFYCHLFERKAVADGAYSSSDEETGMLRY
eukprot:Skav203799  [mRNA]  locus=scaffold206:638813:645457:+ [translate_table: standard]